MELRVWVDGTQRVVCGVKLTTTCQEIVFALAHATQQAGRFTMIERWRNNERLLSPNEQPLVTLQRWGDRMNEVEFILKKTSSDSQPPTNRTNVNHIPTLNQQTSTAASSSNELNRSSKDNESTHQVLTNGHRESPANHASNHSQPIADSSSDSIIQQAHFDLSRRSQAVLGQLTSSNSALNLGANYMQTNSNRLSNSFRPSLSASTLPNSSNILTAPPPSSTSIMRPRLHQDQTVDANSPSLSMNDPHNGYQMHNESHQFVQQHVMGNQSRVTMSAKNYPYEDLYSTINKKRINHLPPAVPAKPRLMNSTLKLNNNAQVNFYPPNSTTTNMYPNNIRPRHPPGYLEYLEAIANRNSLPPSLVSNQNYMHQNQHLATSNIFPRQHESQLSLYNVQPNGSSPAGSSTSHLHFYQANSQYKRASLGQNREFDASSSLQNINPINPKFVESSGLIINRGSAVNVRLTSNSHLQLSQNQEDNLTTSAHNTASSVSQMGLDMLKVIEEQKKVLMNQKNELDRLDNDQEYLEAKQSSEQAELINRIESEIRQLEELWKENQIQINKLENQDFESELEQLQSEQIRMEREIASQKFKLTQCESDIAQCKIKIEQLEFELNTQSLDLNASISNDEKVEMNPNGNDISNGNKVVMKNDDLNLIQTDDQANEGANNENNQQLFRNKNSKSSEDEDDDDDDDSDGDASDDLNTNSYESNKLRSTKELVYVEKRGLISGIRSLKLDKSRSLNKSIESLNSNESASLRDLATNSPNPKEKASTLNNNILDVRCADTSNGQQLKDKTANSNKYEFLMTL